MLIRKNAARFAHFLCDFISIYLFVLTFPVKLKTTNYKSLWNFLVFYDQWKIISNLNMSHWNMSNFVLFWLFEFTLFIKLRNFDFESHWNTLIFLNTLNSQVWLCSVKQCLIWFNPPGLSEILGISWEIRILNFIKIV